jgi:hypothetical protein
MDRVASGVVVSRRVSCFAFSSLPSLLCSILLDFDIPGRLVSGAEHPSGGPSQFANVWVMLGSLLLSGLGLPSSPSPLV